MKIDHLYASDYSASISAKGDGKEITFQLTDEQRIQFITLAYEVLEEHKRALSEAILNTHAPALPKPDCIDGEYTDV